MEERSSPNIGLEKGLHSRRHGPSPASSTSADSPWPRCRCFTSRVSRGCECARVGGPLRDAKPKLASWEDLYRERWTWDRIAKGSHGWLNCRSACNWDLYVKDGVVVREEQTANYEASEPGVPDFNPRGCQKGACYTEVMYGPSRLTVPLKRAGERGEGKWKQISWEQALREIAEKLIDICQRHGGEALVQDLGPHFDLGATNAARNRFFGMLGASLPDDWAEIGDLNVGATLSLGLPHIGGSSDEWFLSDFLVVWMMNPSVTQMSDAHFLYEAKYNGADLAVIDPVYSATAMRADQWLPIRPGTDAALGLATARHIWESGRIDLDYVREQTDLPILVRLDTGRFLRESDLQAGGADDLLYMWDAKQERHRPAPGSQGNDDRVKLFLGELEPVIEGRFEVELADGPQCRRSRRWARCSASTSTPWTFERTAAVTGLDVEVVSAIRRGLRGGRAAHGPVELGLEPLPQLGPHQSHQDPLPVAQGRDREEGRGLPLHRLGRDRRLRRRGERVGRGLPRHAARHGEGLRQRQGDRHAGGPDRRQEVRGAVPARALAAPDHRRDSCLTNSASQNYKFQGLPTISRASRTTSTRGPSPAMWPSPKPRAGCPPTPRRPSRAAG